MELRYEGQVNKLRAEVWLALCERSLDYASTGKSQHIGSCLIVKSSQEAQEFALSVPQTPDSCGSLRAPLESPQKPVL